MSLLPRPAKSLQDLLEWATHLHATSCHASININACIVDKKNTYVSPAIGVFLAPIAVVWFIAKPVSMAVERMVLVLKLVVWIVVAMVMTSLLLGKSIVPNHFKLAVP
ncbi:Hypothetical predicted protein [Olea europaea subsp. europaea]|uniref:Uncharacterized protein n=1 Tax=Olea europaea subsp. europaea TaxID=158383 RepID=A0A8S0S6C7_OLEEU|nr:Hypothetical predicted protein [Olea europaea subsp. europaea]